MAIRFGLNSRSSVSSSKARSASSRNSAFDVDDDEDELEGHDARAAAKGDKSRRRIAAPVITGEDRERPLPEITTASKSPGSRFGNASSQRAANRRVQDAFDVDPTIYDYDAAYDAIHARDLAKKAAEKKAASEGKSRYMDGLLASAEVRKRDLLRAREKALQREREAEGEDFTDKDKFVTGAYKAQQEEVQRIEEEEKQRDADEDRKRKKVGMAGFFRHVIDEQERRHQEITIASETAERTGAADVAQGETQEKSAADLAKEINEKGGNITLNEDGQVVDKRELLSAGLNVVTKAKNATRNPTSKHTQPASYHLKRTGATDSKLAMRDRQTRLLEAQLEQTAKRALDDEAEEAKELARKVKSRKTSTDISDAKQRYLQRKLAASGNQSND